MTLLIVKMIDDFHKEGTASSNELDALRIKVDSSNNN